MDLDHQRHHSLLLAMQSYVEKYGEVPNTVTDTEEFFDPEEFSHRFGKHFFDSYMKVNELMPNRAGDSLVFVDLSKVPAGPVFSIWLSKNNSLSTKVVSGPCIKSDSRRRSVREIDFRI